MDDVGGVVSNAAEENAYVSGMKEDLRLHGNQLNYIKTSWTVGYVIGQIPSNVLITRVRPSIWIPTMELVWGSLTMCLAASKSFSTLCAVRFFIGLAESTFFPAIQYVIGSWYKDEELAKRSCIFHTASALGPMASGFLQAGIYNSLDGSGGLAGWKWLFILDGVISIPIALLGFLVMPDLPSTTKPSILYTQEQLDIAKKRMDSVGRKPPAKFSAFSPRRHIYTLFVNGGGGTTSMIFWLKSFNKPGHVYTIGQINTYPLGIYSLQILTTLVYAWWSDAVLSRWPPIVFSGVRSKQFLRPYRPYPLFHSYGQSSLILFLQPHPYTQTLPGISGLIMAWVNELNSHDSEKRAFVVASCNMWGYVIQAWLPMRVIVLPFLIFPQVEQPLVFKGNVTTAFINFSMSEQTYLTRSPFRRLR
ncbi:major facilitator superfamily domain-containing protein [Russula emetica]|nr:major facilitator superfamily domain-containing protein [Russula emetica]